MAEKICDECTKKIREGDQTHVISPKPLTKGKTQYWHISCYMLQHERFMENLRRASRNYMYKTLSRPKP